jgi:hypothetical protein
MKWKCKDGREIELRDMETGHLKNAIAMLRRQNVVTEDEFLSCAAYACSSSSGEYAAMAAENEMMNMRPWKGLKMMEAELGRREHKQ